MSKSFVPVFVRSGNNYDRDAASNESAISVFSQDMAKQSFKEECDINTIVKRYNLTGELPTNVRMPVPSDFSEVFDFHSAMNAVVQARESFDAMPAEVRYRFHNDPAEFAEFCFKEENLPEARRLGLILPEEVKPPKVASLDDVVQAINASRDAKDQ